MNSNTTGSLIKAKREKLNLTQTELAEILSVSDKTISKWETGKGLPDITLLEKLSETLEISVIELMSGNTVQNTNRSSNMLRSKIHVCPICGNIIHSTGDAVINCHGINLPSLSAEEPDDQHSINVQIVEDEYYIEIEHEMSKNHHISFIAGISDNGIEIIKLYPEMKAEARLKISRTRYIAYFCNKDGLFRTKIKP